RTIHHAGGLCRAKSRKGRAGITHRCYVQKRASVENCCSFSDITYIIGQKLEQVQGVFEMYAISQNPRYANVIAGMHTQGFFVFMHKMIRSCISRYLSGEIVFDGLRKLSAVIYQAK
ncbi:hypothetical protein KHP57_23410, partial [Algiphilus sp. NNCM1]|nr:hypothetical protein [Algiphilus acroporae]